MPIPDSQIRKVQYLDPESNDWKSTTMCALLPGDVFRLFEPDGTLVVDSEGQTQWTVLEPVGVQVSKGTDDSLTAHPDKALGLLFRVYVQDRWIENVSVAAAVTYMEQGNPVRLMDRKILPQPG